MSACYLRMNADPGSADILRRSAELVSASGLARQTSARLVAHARELRRDSVVLILLCRVLRDAAIGGAMQGRELC